ncbi:MAG: anti-sigma regulatory factor [Thermodesulfobacteriota bacterium]
MTKVKEITINRGDDVILARDYAREIAQEIGFDIIEQTQISTATCELSRNAHQFASNGKVTITGLLNGNKRGIGIVVEDRGPGIPDIDQALEDGFSTNNGMGFGLPGARRLMDEFEIESRIGQGTTVKIKKWLKSIKSTQSDTSLDRNLGELFGPDEAVDLNPA